MSFPVSFASDFAYFSFFFFFFFNDTATTEIYTLSLHDALPIWLVARKTLPPNDLKELIAWLRQNPGQATAGTVGVGGASDVTGVYFQNVTDTKFQFVPYRGSAPLNQDLTAGHIDLNLGMAAASYPLVRGGQIKAYAMMAKRRWWAASDIPTMEEAGVPGLFGTGCGCRKGPLGK